jgi:RNA polymerase sigma-70 factor (ECF subfamily)
MDDRERFLALFLRHQHEVRAFVASVVRDAHRAEDVVQEVSLVLWRKFDTYDPSRPFGAWARGVATLEVLKERDRGRRDLPVLSPEGIEAVRRAYDETERPGPAAALDALRNCLKGLPDRARQLLRLRYEESLPHRQRLVLVDRRRARPGRHDPDGADAGLPQLEGDAGDVLLRAKGDAPDRVLLHEDRLPPRGGPHKVIDPAGNVAQAVDVNGDWVGIPVPAGMDGKLWRLREPVLGIFWFNNIPNYIAASPDALLVPREVAARDGLQVGP